MRPKLVWGTKGSSHEGAASSYAVCSQDSAMWPGVVRKQQPTGRERHAAVLMAPTLADSEATKDSAFQELTCCLTDPDSWDLGHMEGPLS